MEQALLDKHLSPHKSVREVVAAHGIPPSTLHDHLSGTHGPKGPSPLRNLSPVLEAALVAKINKYADRGTLLIPAHISELARALCGHEIGRNWTSTFLRRYREVFVFSILPHSGDFKARANTVENRRAYYNLVSAVAL
jgi:hypothetical protein